MKTSSVLGSIANPQMAEAYAEDYAERQSAFYYGEEENNVEYGTRFQIGGQYFDQYLEELFGV